MKSLVRLRNGRSLLAICGTFAGAVALQAQSGGTQSPDTAFGVATANSQVYIGGQVAGAIPGQTAFGKSDGFLQAFTQGGAVLWTAQFGTSAKDEINGVAADSTGVYAGGLTEGAFAGQTYLGNTDAFIVKYDLNGNQLWVREYGTTGVDRIQAAASDGTYLYVTGYTSGSLEGQPIIGGQDAFIQKWDQSGNLIWTTQFGTTGTDRAYGVAVRSNGIFVTGRTDGAFPGQSSQGGIDAFLASFSAIGKMQWVAQFGTSGDDRGWGIGTDQTGIYVTGRTEGAFPGQTYLGDDDAFAVKYTFTGNQLWVSEFGTSRFDRGTSLSADTTGAYACGYTQGTLPGERTAGYTDAYIRKYDESGDVLWTTQFGSPQFDAAWGTATDSTGVYVGGTAGGELPGQAGAPNPNGYFVQKFDTDGNVLWVYEVSTSQK